MKKINSCVAILMGSAALLTATSARLNADDNPYSFLAAHQICQDGVLNP